METPGFFELPDTLDGCLDAAIKAEESGKDAQASFLLDMAELHEEDSAR